MMASPNAHLIDSVARRLAPLLDDLVFVGGQVTELLFTDPRPRGCGPRWTST
jgi:hypothetical protein